MKRLGLVGCSVAALVISGCAQKPSLEWQNSQYSVSSEGVITPFESVCDADDDQDGVMNTADMCPSTPIGALVDGKGCPVVESISLNGVNFVYKSSELTAEAKSVLDEAIKVLKTVDDAFVIEGHTDSIASESYNRKLSQQRADSVRAYLMMGGVDSSRMQSVGMGESQPIASNETEEGRQMNRRVVFKLSK